MSQGRPLSETVWGSGSSVSEAWASHYVRLLTYVSVLPLARTPAPVWTASYRTGIKRARKVGLSNIGMAAFKVKVIQEWQGECQTMPSHDIYGEFKFST